MLSRRLLDGDLLRHFVGVLEVTEAVVDDELGDGRSLAQLLEILFRHALEGLDLLEDRLEIHSALDRRGRKFRVEIAGLLLLRLFLLDALDALLVLLVDSGVVFAAIFDLRVSVVVLVAGVVEGVLLEDAFVLLVLLAELLPILPRLVAGLSANYRASLGDVDVGDEEPKGLGPNREVGPFVDPLLGHDRFEARLRGDLLVLVEGEDELGDGVLRLVGLRLGFATWTVRVVGGLLRGVTAGGAVRLLGVVGQGVGLDGLEGIEISFGYRQGVRTRTPNIRRVL